MSAVVPLTRVSQVIYWSGLGVLIGLCVAMPGYLEHGPLKHSVHRAIAADNFTTFVLCFATVGVLIAHYNQRKTWDWEERRVDFHATVALLLALGTHRLLWLPWRVLLELNDKPAADIYRDTWAQWTSVPQGAWWVACFLIAAPIYRQWFGRTGWIWAAVLAVSLIWLMGYQIPDFVRMLS